MTEWTSERSRTVAAPDGTLTTEVTSRPVRFRGADGAWQALDLARSEREGWLRPTAAPAAAPRVRADTGSSGRVIEFGEGDRLFTWRAELSDDVPAQPKRPLRPDAPAEVLLEDVLPAGRDLRLELGVDRVKESLVLPSHAAAAAGPGYRNVFSVPEGVIARQAPLGVEFVDPLGVSVAVFGGGHAFDSSRSEAGEPATAPVATTLVGQMGRTVTVSVSTDPAWLADPARVYPVTVDPDFYANTSGGGHGDAYVDTLSPTTAYGWYDAGQLKVGTRAEGTTETLLDFVMPFELNGEGYPNNVLSSTLSIYNNYSYSCMQSGMPAVHVTANSTGWSPDAVTWNTRPGVAGPVVAATFANGYSGACPGNWASFNVKDIVQQWSRGTVADWGFRLGAANSLHLGYKRFLPGESGNGSAPALTITWEECTTYSNGHKLCSEVRDHYEDLKKAGIAADWLPSTDSAPTTDGEGRYAHFTRNGADWATISWHPKEDVGVAAVWGDIRARWAELGWTAGFGFPIGDQQLQVDGFGWRADFIHPYVSRSPSDGAHGSILWRPDHPELVFGGRHAIAGGIRDRWVLNGAQAAVGYPLTDELVGGQDGRYQKFGPAVIPTDDLEPEKRNQTILWSSNTGAHAVRGGFRELFEAAGSETGWLGYPTEGERPVTGGSFQGFTGGNLTWEARSGVITEGAGTLKHPTTFQRITQRRTQLKASANESGAAGGRSYDKVSFQWRPYSLDPSSAWTAVPTGHLTTSSGGSVSDPLGLTSETVNGATVKHSATYTWNATSTIALDGLAQVRACFTVTGGTQQYCSGPTQVTVDRAGLSGASATADVGPGTVSLLTGTSSVTGRDAEVTAPHGGLAATRTFLSNAPTRPGPLGPGWRLSLAVDEAGADFESLVDRTETVLVTRGDGTQMPFVRRSGNPVDANTLVAEGEAATGGATLTFTPGTAATTDPARYTLTDLDGDKTVFVRADGGTGHTDGAQFRVEKVEAIRGKTGSTQLAPATTTVVYTAAGNPHLLLAPADDGTSCPNPLTTSQPAGCRALEFTYTGTGSAERLTTIKLKAHGPGANAAGLVDHTAPVAAQTITLAEYTYDSGNRLVSVSDPRTGLTVGYSYRSDGRLATVTPPGGTAVWTLGYDDQAQPRLASGTVDDGSGGLDAQTTSVRYDLPVDGSNPSLPTLTAGEIARWGQSTVPTDLTATFGPDTVPDTATTEAQWRGATLSALDVNGRVVNTAGFGGTVDQDTGTAQTPAWRIGTIEYDTAGRGNVVRQLTAGNRDRALAAGADSAAEAAQARLLDTVHVYSADGMDLLRSYGPARPVTPAPGGLPVHVRSRTSTVYDTGSTAEVALGHPTAGQSLHLPVSSTADAVPVSTADGLPAGKTVTDLGVPAFDGNSRLTTLEYGNTNAWRFGRPTATRVQPGGGAAEVVSRESVDEQGRTVTRTLPVGGTSTTTAATTTTSYYAASSADPACVSAAYAGWLCKSAHGLPSAGFVVPTTRVSRYDVYGNPLETIETAADGVVRTSRTSYDPAGRVRRAGGTGTGTQVGLAQPEVETTYTAAGLVAQTRLLVGGGTADGTGPISRGYDAYHRPTSYTDGTGLTTATNYDSVGRLATVSNAHGSRTVGYDGGGERGSLPTSIVVSGVGTFTASYGADGTLVHEGLPGNLTATTVRDAAGDPVSLAYRKSVDGVSTEWLRSTATMTGFDQVDSYRVVSANGVARTNRYGYDHLGRLTTAVDSTTVDSNGLPTGASCTRSYSFDVNSNRTGLTQTASAGAPAGTCPTSTAAADSYSYDTADRLLPGAAGTPRATLSYDRLGRTRTLPSVDTQDNGGDLTLDFYLDDLVASISQNGRTSTFGLDPARRRTVRTDTNTATPSVTARTVSHYSGDDDSPDSVTELDTTLTRNITGFGNLAAVVTAAGTPIAAVTLQLANLHGDIAATVAMNATSPSQLTVTETTEYGLARTAPAAGITPNRYGWLGTHQRDTSTPGGLTLMGVRLYAPTLGRFLSVDPVEGGSANDYDYGLADPVGHVDLDGRYATDFGEQRGTAGVIGGSNLCQRQFCIFRWYAQIYPAFRTLRRVTYSGSVHVNGRKLAGCCHKAGVGGDYTFHSSIGGNKKAGFGTWKWDRRGRRDQAMTLRPGDRVQVFIRFSGYTPSGKKIAGGGMRTFVM